ncbi:DNA polymerase III subunit beta [Candidatus Woesebacteria bacterium RIFOXYB1_FULL_38_16]|uniref:Beta sliding clamp n=1 Tax=Candidatus Woesebacteria bacterium RIFOXYB1_FULL_38_16 TaxID=1802538 RepID=A0A1F8CU02_9BACT|nr:MAG: DNA polymerase III subunit beta [Candidatus Woesebacteria bacterium RIFOXYB1_FULL_38_16]
MNFRVLQNEFHKTINVASRFVSTRSQLPILENIVLKAEKTRLTIKATNLEMFLVTSIGAKVNEEGEIAVRAKILGELIANLEGEALDVVVKKEKVKLSSEGFEASIMGMNTADFPELSKKESDGVEIGFEDLKKVLGKVMFSVSRDDTRPVLTGVLFSFMKDELVIAASDGFRLSKNSIKLKGLVSEEKKMIIPRGVLSEFVRMEKGENESVKLGLNQKDKQVVFEFSGIVLGSRVIEGEYPDFGKIIPEKTNVKIVVGKEDLLRAVKTASVFARDSGNVVRFEIKEGEIVVVSESAKSGVQKGRVAAKIEGDVSEMSISFNFRFIEEFLGVVDRDSVVMELTDSNSPGIFRVQGNDDFFHLIMPVRVQS